jgi:multidrug resistance efflux pump
MPRRTAWLLFLVTFALGTALGVYFWRRQPEPLAQPEAVQPAAAPTEITLAARVRARFVVPVAAPIDGTLESLETDEGQEVYEGQLLARIQNASLAAEEEETRLEIEKLQTRVNSLDSQLIAARLELSRADADTARLRALLQAAEKAFLRQKLLLAEGATARLAYEKAESDFNASRTEHNAASDLARQAVTRIETVQRALDEAKRGLAEQVAAMEEVESRKLAAEIHAPSDGLIVGIRAAAGGEVNRAMTDLFQIATNLSQLECVAEVTPAQAALLKTGQAVLLQIAESANEPLSGTVKSIEGGRAVVEFESANPLVKPGLTAQIRIALI